MAERYLCCCQFANKRVHANVICDGLFTHVYFAFPRHFPAPRFGAVDHFRLSTPSRPKQMDDQNRWTILASALSLHVTSAGIGETVLQVEPRGRVLTLSGNANAMARSLYVGSARTQVLDVNIRKPPARSQIAVF